MSTSYLAASLAALLCTLADGALSDTVGSSAAVAAMHMSRLEVCAKEAVKWALMDENVTDPIFVDGTNKFRHIRVDGYAEHWATGIWAFVSVPATSNGLAGELVVGYNDPINKENSAANEKKRTGMRHVLDRCVRGFWPAGPVQHAE